MIETTQRSFTEKALRGKLSASYAYLKEHGDGQNAEKVRQLAEKFAKGEFAVAFCGHFSAGKSTMINRLIGEKLLPSSPIPTSANLVKVKAGEEYAKVYFKNGKPRLYPAPYDYAMVKNYCQDGDKIESVEISHAGSSLPPQVVIMDTPGIDSADDAHRVATESAIHLADFVFYVMDYNHVQSELNFMFTKELTEAGKEIYLVINQVDKHVESDLPFARFKESTVKAFAAWGVKPVEIFYTSLKEDCHEHNAFSRLRAFLTRRLAEKDELLRQSTFFSLQKILNDHLKAAAETQAHSLAPSCALLNELPPAEQAALLQNYERMLEKRRELSESTETAERAFDAAADKIMANAYLMPFQTRALAEAYLAACQPKFKVGWLPNRQKAAAERAARREAFYQEVREKANTQLAWHLRDFLLRFAQDWRVEDKELLAKIQAYAIPFAPVLLENALKEGAQLSGAYVLNYTDSVANEIKRLAKAGLTAIKGELLRAVRAQSDGLQAELAKSAAKMEKYIAALEQVKHHESSKRRAQAEIQALLAKEEEFGGDDFRLFGQKDEEIEIIRSEIADTLPKASAAEVQALPPVPDRKEPAARLAVDKLKDVAGKLRRTAALVKELPGFAKLADELSEKADRLSAKGFSVVLFGAFSAGKSSFANALIGEKILPVSPNPTTASINKIMPVNALNPHGSVRVKCKEEQAMLEDLNQALRAFDLSADSLADALTKAKSLAKGAPARGAAKANYAFVQAFARGYDAFCKRLGTVFAVTFAEFRAYVAEEEKSCFVEWIELYYDCPLTCQGITLVDTPGADSINARHTGVSFEFIKNSDAVLFVTYYNHAFSRADREFLIQLGRVKDAFQLDKMFFMINAVDLAGSEEEKETVAAYVRAQLIKYGVSKPQLFPLSSLKALNEKRRGEAAPVSGMALFEEHFYHFIKHDLSGLAARAAEEEMERAICLVEKLIGSIQEDDDVKRQKRTNLERERTAIREILRRPASQALKERLFQETEELVYYSRQRVFLRFNEFFRETFNPSVLRGDGRDLPKALQGALRELIEEIGFSFAQEMRATTVRLDRFAERLLTQLQASLSGKMGEVNGGLSFSPYESNEKARLEFAPAFQDIRTEMFAKALAHFKNAKSFFEGGESKRMGEEIQRILAAETEPYLQAEKKRLQDAYGAALENESIRLTALLSAQAEDFYLSLNAALEGGVPLEKLITVRQSLREMQ